MWEEELKRETEGTGIGSESSVGLRVSCGFYVTPSAAHPFSVLYSSRDPYNPSHPGIVMYKIKPGEVKVPRPCLGVFRELHA